jgi:hypothetical protein
MILTGGPDVWFIRMGVGGDGVAVDALLGSDRRVDWPYVQGTWGGADALAGEGVGPRGGAEDAENRLL